MRIIVTGASGALGSAVVTLAASRGHKIAAVDLYSPAILPEGVFEISGDDIADAEGARAATSSAIGVMGGVDALIHLAGGFSWCRVEESNAEGWKDLYRTNVETSLNMVQSVLGKITPGGSIICVGAASAQPAGIGMAPYAAAKSAVARMVESLSQELKSVQIRVNAVLPSIIDTPRNRADMPDADPAEWTSTDAIAETLLFLAGPEARAINGALIPVTNNA